MSEEIRSGRSRRAGGGALLAVRQELFGGFESGNPWWVRLRAFNGLALVALGAALVTLTVWISRPVAEAGEDLDARGGAEELAASFAAEDEELAGSATQFSTRSLFEQPKAPRESRPRRANVTLSELSRKLTLQGVLGGETPRAIILNGSTRQVLHLAEGEYVGEIQVSEIREQSVILSWKDETLELIL